MKYTASQLYEIILTENQIYCNGCSGKDSITSDPDEAAEYFFKAGWRVTKSQKVYCPECANKKLKP